MNFDFNRRQVLQTGIFTGLPWLTPLGNALAAQADKQKNLTTRIPKSLIVVWLKGGASQLETFDPHPGKEISYGGAAIETAIKGAQFGTGLEQTAAAAENFSVIRSMVSKEGDHSRATYNMNSGYRPVPGLFHPSIGSVLCHERPLSGIDIPAHISIMPGSFPTRGGYLGANFDPFQMGDPLQPVPGISSKVGEKRQKDRLASLKLLEKGFAAGRIPDLDQKRTLHQINTQKALQMMSSEQLQAFDIKNESSSTVKSFGDTRFGRGCLAAIRLVESGVRCVEVSLGGWDTHANNAENQQKRIKELDPALANLFHELKKRDLYDSTIVLCATEFGRTPKLNPANGRDHWPHGFSVLIGGGGLRSGQVIGETDPEGKSKKPGKPVTVADLHSTIYTAFDIDTEHEFVTPTNRPIKISDGYPVEALL